MPIHVDLSPQEITVPVVVRNASPARLYEDALTREQAGVVSSGAIAIRSGAKTGRSPKDKHIVRHRDSEKDVWWGSINHPIDEHTFLLENNGMILSNKVGTQCKNFYKTECMFLLVGDTQKT